MRLALLALALTSSLLAEIRPLTILHVNDIHAQITPRPDGQGGFAYLKATLDRERAGCPQCLVVQAGDMVQGSVVSTVFKGTPIFELANLFRFDAGTLGNHDFDYGPEKLAGFVKLANYPIVSVNIRNGAGVSPVPPSIVIERGGLRIGVVGVMTETLKTLVTPEALADFRTTPAIEAVRQAAAALRAKTDIIILLAHFTPEEEQVVLREASDVNVVVGAHLHTALPQPTQFEGRLLVRLNSNATEVGRLELQVDTETKKIVKSDWRRIAVGANTIKPDAEMQQAVAAWDAKVSQLMDIPIGESKRLVPRAQLRGWCERVLTDTAEADLGYCNAGGMRAAMPEGVINVRHIWDTMPFDNRIVVGKFKGSELPREVTQGRQIDADKEYTLATSDYVAGTTFTNLKFRDTGKLLRDAMVEWVKRHKGVE